MVGDGVVVVVVVVWVVLSLFFVSVSWIWCFWSWFMLLGCNFFVLWVLTSFCSLGFYFYLHLVLQFRPEIN